MRRPNLASLLVLLAAALLGVATGDSSPSSNTSAVTTAAGTSETPLRRMAGDAQTITEIERRLKDNSKYLKQYYATPEKVKQAMSDIVRLSFAKVEYGENGKTKEDKALGKRAAALLPRVSQQAREMYASSMEETMVKNGLDARVRARGSEKKQLTITYALMSQPLVYKFQNEIDLSKQAIPLGFTKLVYTNGFESELGKTWTIDLRPGR
jgi:hypothetical protein